MKKFKNPIQMMIAYLLFISCNHKNEYQDINLEKFTISVPSNWKKIDVKGIDSNFDVILTQNNDSIYLDLGKYSQEFNETHKVFSREQIQKYDSLKMDTKKLHFSDTPEIDQAQGTFLKEYYYYDTIYNKVAKIKVPKKSEIGETGIFFKNGDSEKLTIIGNNLKAKEQIELLKSFETIRFKK